MIQKKMLMLAGAGVLGLALLGGTTAFWMHKSRYMETENAFVQADTVLISPQIGGRVLEVLVRDNQTVSAGQVLVRIEDGDAQARLAQAEARLLSLKAALSTVDMKSSLQQAQTQERAAAMDSARARAKLAETDLNRYGTLAREGWVSDQRIQTLEARATEARSQTEQAKAALVAQQRDAASLGGVKAQTLAQIQEAEALVDQARLDLDRTVLRAPRAGVIGGRAVREGLYIRPGQQLMQLVPLGQTYVVANFKETQVAKLAIGQSVSLHADAFPGKTLKGQVDSFSPATGSEFALIPIENATGNFTKIVQRVPVRIAIDPRDPLAGALRPGLSIKVTVDTQSQGTTGFAEAARIPPTMASRSERP